MKKILVNKNLFPNLLIIFLISLPFIDVITSLMTYFCTSVSTIGMVLKFLVLICGFVFIMFHSEVNKQHKKIVVLYSIIFLIYLIFYFLSKTELMLLPYFLREIKLLLKMFYFPFIFFIIFLTFNVNNIEAFVVKKILLYNLFGYVLLFFLSYISGTGFYSYKLLNQGFNSWFYAANETGAIFVILVSFLFNQKKSGFTNSDFMLTIATIFLASLISTKVVFLGLLIILFFELVQSLFKFPNADNKKIIAIILSLVIVLVGPSTTNFVNRANTERTLEKVEFTKEEKNKLETKSVVLKKAKNSSSANFMLRMLSNRDLLFLNTYEIYYNNLDLNVFLFGLGNSNTPNINNSKIEKLIEIDIFDYYFHYGLIGMILLIIPFIYLFIELFRKKLFKVGLLRYFIVLSLTLGISLFAGHIFTVPTIVIYLVLIIYLIIKTHKNLYESNKKKIDILALHLGHGGVESSLVSQASMLSEKYDVRIVSLYKNNTIVHDINPKVEILYLTNTISNKEKIKKSLSEKNIIIFIKETFKAVNIFLKKQTLMKRHIVNSDAGIIISTRYSFTKELNDYGNTDAVKIGEEHTFNLNNAYLKKYNKLKNIDYLIVVSKYIEKEYKKNINNIQIKYIPNSLEKVPNSNEISKINNKKLISIGRLEQEKGFLDLIDVFCIVNKKDPSLTLDIYGDGSEKSAIENKIKEYKLGSKIKLHGFKNKNVINKALSNSSLYIMTSLEESFGIVLIEAMSYGVPCLAFDSAIGAVELLTNTGIVVKRKKELMAEKILTYFDLPISDKKEYQNKALKKAKEFTNEQVKNKWFKLLEENEKNSDCR